MIRLLVLALLFCAPAMADSNRLRCIGGEGMKTPIGEAVVTAGHLSELCGVGQSLSKRLDVSVIKRGDPGACRDAALGENVYISGPRGDVVRGLVLRQNQTIKANAAAGGKVKRTGVDLVLAPKVKAGWSGGPVVSVNDHRVVGMVLVASRNPVKDNLYAVYVRPIESICEKLSE